MQKAPNEPQEQPSMPPPLPPPPKEGAANENMPDVQSIPDALSEHIPESIKQPKVGLSKAIDTARQTILGSGKIIEEITVVKDTSVDLAKNSILLPASTLVNLVKGHPVNATREFASKTAENLKKAAILATSPTRLAFAGGASVVDLAKKNVKLPVKAAVWAAKSPLRVWDMMNKGADKLFNIGKKFESWNKGG